jgi:hypothetical protein
MLGLDWSIACAAKSRRHAYIEEEETLLAALAMTAGEKSLSTLRSSELRLCSAS